MGSEMCIRDRHSDIIVLLSGDGDFDILVDRVKSQYKSLVEVYGVEKLTASSLVRVANRFIPIESDLLLG